MTTENTASDAERSLPAGLDDDIREIQRLREQNAVLQEQVEMAAQALVENEQLKRQKERIQADLGEAEQRNREIQDLLIRDTKRLNDANEAVQALLTQRAELAASLHEVREKLASGGADKEVARLAEEAETLKAQLASATGQVKALQDQKINLQESLTNESRGARSLFGAVGPIMQALGDWTLQLGPMANERGYRFTQAQLMAIAQARPVLDAFSRSNIGHMPSRPRMSEGDANAQFFGNNK